VESNVKRTLKCRRWRTEEDRNAWRRKIEGAEIKTSEGRRLKRWR
jgi:hypothetical protein